MVFRLLDRDLLGLKLVLVGHRVEIILEVLDNFSFNDSLYVPCHFIGLMGNYVFQVDGRRLGQLAHALEELMLRRIPALTAPPGTRVLPSTTSEDSTASDSIHLRKSAAIDIRGSGKSAVFGASSSSLSPAGSGAVFGGSASPQGPNGTSTAFAPSSLPTRGGNIVSGPVSGMEEIQQHTGQQNSSSTSSSSRSKKSSHHKQLFGGIFLHQ